MTASKLPADFGIIILSNGRPDNIQTLRTLERQGYKGKYYIVIDDLDKSLDKYKENFGDKVVIFDKRKAGELFDRADNREFLKAVVYARNAAFGIAKDLGLKYFLVLDDDYSSFEFRFDDTYRYTYKNIPDIEVIFSEMLQFYIDSGAKTLCMYQNGDFIGGQEGSPNAKKVMLSRKAMNSFFCSVDRPFRFDGLINEDVNSYCLYGSRGDLFFSTNQVSLKQQATQSNDGGLTDIYLELGTYLKSFYTVMMCPSFVKVVFIGSGRGRRLHHRVEWKNAVPKILSEDYRL